MRPPGLRFRAAPSPTVRAALALAVTSAWLVLLLSGVALGGVVHLLLAAALALFPWRWLRRTGAAGGGGKEAA